MRRFLSLLLILVMMASMFIGCSDESFGSEVTGATGSFRAVVGSDATSRTIQPAADDLQIASYALYGAKDYPTNPMTKLREFTEKNVEVEALVVGNWSFRVEGYNADGKMVASSELKPVTISAGTQASASFKLAYAGTGKGVFRITVRIPEANPEVDTLHVFDKSADEDICVLTRPETPVEGYYVFTGSAEMDGGSYLIGIDAYKKDAVKEYENVYVSALYVVGGIESVLDYTCPYVLGGAAEPEITRNGDMVTITAKEGSDIYYHVGEQDIKKWEYQFYEEPIELMENGTVYAYAVLGNGSSKTVSLLCMDVHAKTPEASLAAGNYDEAQTVELSSRTPDARIFYTLDGSTPTSASKEYTGPITISASATLKAVAMKTGLVDSEIASYAYVFPTGDGDFTVQDPDGLNALSLTVPDAWESGEVVGPIATGTISASLATPVNGTTYRWEVDFKDETGWTSENSFTFEDADGSFPLSYGVHQITCYAKVLVAGQPIYYSETFVLKVSRPGAYVVGGRGPAGGLIFYDCDADNTEEDPDGPDNLLSSVCGWRYLEANESSIGNYIFGFNVSGGSYRQDGVTSPALGKGLENTRNIVATMGEYAYGRNLTDRTTEYAAKKADDYRVTLSNGTVIDDWFLPSTGELAELKHYYSGNLTCWSSYIWNSTKTYFYYNGVQSLADERGVYLACIPVRRFAANEPYGHQYESSFLKAASCTETGTLRYSCTTCSDYYDVEIPPAHDAVPTIGSVAVCSTCGKAIYGPAGGYIFYDCDADNNSGNADNLRSATAGWRYLEAAPFDLSYSSSTNIGFNLANTTFCFGCSGYVSRDSDGDDTFNYQFVNKKTTYNASTCTSTAIGSGGSNTDRIYEAIGNETFYEYTGRDSDTASMSTIYAAKMAKNLSYNGYSDWFIPSKDELNLLYENMKQMGIGDLKDAGYWSSSEDSSSCERAWAQNFSTGVQGGTNRNGYASRRVRTIRYVTE